MTDRVMADIEPSRVRAIAAAGRIFYRPARVVAQLLHTYADVPERDYPGDDAVTRVCYEHPVRVGGTLGVFGLKALHWPMLNLTDTADRDRRAFGAAMCEVIQAARGATPSPA